MGAMSRLARGHAWAGLWIVLVASPIVAQVPEPKPPLRDNSFLVEEAYNQEPGVVQHVGTFAIGREDGWAAGFDQEWPLGGMRDQLSWGLGVLNTGRDTRFEDVVLNYRRQLIGESESRVLFAPRISALWLEAEEGSDGNREGVGVQVGLPATVVLTPWLVTHWNLGATMGPMRPVANAGASAVWLAAPWMNLLVETVWTGQSGTAPVYLLNPGARWAINAGSLQIVPGVSFPIDLRDTGEGDAVLFYLSFEHPY
jgi:hypothetical protein